MSEVIGEAIAGGYGVPGQYYRITRVSVSRVRSGRYELSLQQEFGANQGRHEPHNFIERRWRAGSLDDLLRVVVAELRRDEELKDLSEVEEAVREAIFDAEDAEEEVRAK